MAARLARVKADGPGVIRFAWMGSVEKDRQPALLRIQGPSFLIEMRQHAEQREPSPHRLADFTGDFGVDLLQEHYEQDPYHVAQRQ